MEIHPLAALGRDDTRTLHNQKRLPSARDRIVHRFRSFDRDLFRVLVDGVAHAFVERVLTAGDRLH